MRIINPVTEETDNLPTRLPNPRNFTLQAQRPEANSAHTKPAQEPPHTPTDLTPMIIPNRELRLDSRFISKR